jgi:hypothetical protein
MTEYFEATDSDETWTIWANNPQFPEHPIAVVDEHQVADGFWPDVVARMTGTTILSDVDRRIVQSCADVSPENVESIRKIHKDRLAEWRPKLSAAQRALSDMQRAVAMREASLGILAALTGVSHEV